MALSTGQIEIDPLPTEDRISTSAVDLTLGEEFHRWRKLTGGGAETTIDPSHPEFDYPQLARVHQETIRTDDSGSIIIRPGELVLALTRERVVLPETSRLAARVEGRSTLARLGLAIHLTAPIIHAGFRGRITLEMTNQGPIPIRLCPGLTVCQLVFEMLFGTPQATMTGIFQDQESVAGRLS